MMVSIPARPVAGMPAGNPPDVGTGRRLAVHPMEAGT
jgi:hypothetical protein